MGNYTVVVIDFETTGLSPNMGDRTIEVGAVLVSNNQIIDRFQSLMNPGMRISGFIESFTGINNKMLSSAPSISEVMGNLKTFIADHQLVAHNASFDLRFLDAEFNRINHKRKNEFACSMLSSRRIYPDAPNCKLETLVRFKKLKTDGTHHRALADAEMTAHLWMRLIEDIKETHGLKNVPFKLMQNLSKIPKNKVSEILMKARESAHSSNRAN
ncbi:MAG: 3'-5' exonuclease [Bacteriovorax sp.]|nr:3'-5' exonuclease [Bacteriovorax sp.]